MLQSPQIEQVACRQLGFSIGQRVSETLDTPVGESVSPWWLEEVTCNGTEASIADCTRTRFGETSACLGGSARGSARIRCTNAGMVTSSSHTGSAPPPICVLVPR